MEVSSPPTIRSLVCVPQRPGGGRSASENRWLWDWPIGADGFCDGTAICDGFGAWGEITPCGVYESCDPNEPCDGSVPCEPNEPWDGTEPWDPKMLCDGVFCPCPNKFDNIDWRKPCNGLELCDCVGKEDDEICCCNGVWDDEICCWDGVWDGQQT